jgi:hypothetical protein
MKAKLSDVLVQLGVAVGATVLASLVLKTLAPLDVTQIALVAVAFFAAVEAVIILRQRSASRSSNRQPLEPARESKPKPYGETMWTSGWKRFEYAIGLVSYADVLWMPEVPKAQGHRAERVGWPEPIRRSTSYVSARVTSGVSDGGP